MAGAEADSHSRHAPAGGPRSQCQWRPADTAAARDRDEKPPPARGGADASGLTRAVPRSVRFHCVFTAFSLPFPDLPLFFSLPVSLRREHERPTTLSPAGPPLAPPATPSLRQDGAGVATSAAGSAASLGGAGGGDGGPGGAGSVRAGREGGTGGGEAGGAGGDGTESAADEAAARAERRRRRRLSRPTPSPEQ